MASLSSTLSTIWNNAVSAVSSIPDEWNARVAELRAAIAEFETLYSTLERQRGIAQTDPVLYADYTAIMKRGAYVKSVISDTLNKLGSALTYAKSIIGLGGLGNLGALPLIPIAVVVGALGLITKWLADARLESRKLSVLEQNYNDAKAMGASRAELAAIAHQAATSDDGFFKEAGSFLNKAVVIFVVAGALYLLAPSLKKMLPK